MVAAKRQGLFSNNGPAASMLYTTFMKGGVFMAEKKFGKGFCGYAGSIKNSGAQKVQAPMADKSKKGTASVKTGDDLRNGKSGK